MVKPIRFTREARKHKIGKASAYHVIATVPVVVGTSAVTGDTTLTWIGADDRGRNLAIVAIEKPDCFLVIHVQPEYRRKNP